MKTLKRLEITVILLFVAIIVFASFFGIYKKEDFRVVNIIKKYALGMQFTDSIVFTGNVKKEEVLLDSDGNVVEDEDDEIDYSEENGYSRELVAVSGEENLTKENFKRFKKIIINRLKGMGIGEYRVNINEETGEVTIKLQENDEASEIKEHIEQQGKFTIVDKETGEVLLDNSHVKSSKVVYGASQEDPSTTIVYLQLNFNKEGKRKLEEISQIYVKKEVETEYVEENAEETDDAKYVSVLVDEQTLSSTYFGEKMSTGVLYIPVTQASDTETLRQYVNEINKISTVINNGQLPLEYEFTEETVETSITQNMIFIGILIPSLVLLIANIFLIIKFKARGFIDVFLQIGYIALLILVIRYTNVTITIEGIVAIVLSVVLNYIFNLVVLKNLKQEAKIDWKIVGKFALYTAIIYVASVILAFNKLTVINSFGMSLVWGSICLYIYNLTITKGVLEMINK